MPRNTSFVIWLGYQLSARKYNVSITLSLHIVFWIRMTPLRLINLVIHCRAFHAVLMVDVEEELCLLTYLEYHE